MNIYLFTKIGKYRNNASNVYVPNRTALCKLMPNINYKGFARLNYIPNGIVAILYH